MNGEAEHTQGHSRCSVATENKQTDLVRDDPSGFSNIFETISAVQLCLIFFSSSLNVEHFPQLRMPRHCAY